MPDLKIHCNETIWIKIKQRSESFLLCVLYSPKTSDAVFFEQLNRNIEAAMDISKNILVVGDFNDDLLNDNKHYLKDVLLINSLQNVINVPTRGHTLLDPILVPLEYPVLDKGELELPALISNHKATFLTIPFDYPITFTYKRRVCLYKKGIYQELKEKVESYDWNFINDAPVNDIAELFEDTFLGLVNECIPSKEVTIHTDDKPWYDHEIRKYSRQRDRLRKKALNSQNPSHWHAYKTARNKVNNLKKHAKEIFYSNLEDMLTETMTNNKQDFWKTVRHFVKRNKSSGSIPPLVTADENLETKMHVTDQEKVECLNEYFTSISTISDEVPQIPNLIPKTDARLEQIEISEQEVLDMLETLNTDKASGPDGISNKMMKAVAQAIAKPLTALYNRLLKNHIFPEIYKYSLVTSLPKKGENFLLSDYRPVALLSNVGKGMERIVFKQVYNFLLENELLYKYQSGFIPGHSTTLN